MARKRKAAVSRNPVTAASLLPRDMGEAYRGGIRRPNIVTGNVDVDKTRLARIASGGGLGVGAPATRQGAAGTRTAGMLIDNVQTSRAFLSGYALEAYRTSFANGLNNRSGTYDVPGYFVQMNQLNGGILYWPVTLQEKYQWFRYFCYFLDDKHLGQVLMANGTQKSIKDIQVGDEVITGQGTIRRVAEKIERQCSDQKAVEIGVWCLQNSSLVTHEHPFYILRRNKVKKDECHYRDGIDFSPEWVEAEKIEVGDYVLMAPYKPEKQSNLTKDEASFLGYYASEGSLVWGLRCTSTVGDEGEKRASGWKWHQEKVKVPIGATFTLHKDEENTIGKSIIDLCLRVFNVEAKIIRRRNNTIEIGVYSRIIGEFCHLHVGCGSIDKSLSRDLLDASIESKKAFLLAYAEGDGHQYLDGYNKGKLLIVTASESLASQVQVLAISAGVMCRIAKYERKNDKWSNNPIWHVTIPSWCADALVVGSSKWEKSDSPRDRHCALFVNGYAAFKVEHVAYMEKEGTVYNLELDAQGDEKSFICNGMIAHNCRTDAYVGRALDLLTSLPMSKLTLNMPKMEGKEKLRKEIQSFYQYQIEKIGLEEICYNILFERNVIGNCFLFHEFSEETQMWERVVILPPEEVYVFQLPFSDHRRVEYRPERLMALIKSDGKEMILGQSGLSEDIVKHIPEEISEMVRREGCIVMDSDPMTGSFVAHISRGRHPYMDLGASILERVLIPLLQNENYRYTQLSLANRNMTPKNLINAVGLLQEELDDLRTQVDLSYLDPDYSIITNYEVNWQQIGAQDRILNLDSEHERIENQIFAAMGVTRELLTGEGSYSGNKITVEILNTMFLQERGILKNYIERQLFMPLAEKRGWFEVGAFGAKKYYYPQISFNRLTIRDNQEVFESLFQLYQKGSLNVDIIYELFNLNGDEVRDKLLADAFTVKDPTFNRLLEEVHAEVGRNLSQTTNVLDRIAKGLNLTITNPPNVPQGQGEEGAAPTGFGEGFGAPAAEAQAEGDTEPLALFPKDTPTPKGAQGVQGPAKKPTVDEVADAVAENLPAHADEKDIKDVVDRATKPTVDEVADAVVENLPSHAIEKDIKDVVDSLQTRRIKKPTLQDVADAVAENIPPTATDKEIFDIVNKVTDTK